MTFRSRKYPNFSYNLFGKFQGTRTFICCHFRTSHWNLICLVIRDEWGCSTIHVPEAAETSIRIKIILHHTPFDYPKNCYWDDQTQVEDSKFNRGFFLWRCILHPNPNYWCSMDVPPLPLPWVPAKHMFQLRKVEEIYFHWWSSMQTFRILVYMEWSGAQNRPKSIRGKQCMYRFHYIGHIDSDTTSVYNLQLWAISLKQTSLQPSG